MKRTLNAVLRRLWPFLAGLLVRSGLIGPLVRLAGRYRLAPSARGRSGVRRAGSGGFQVLLYHRVGDSGDPFLPALPAEVFEGQMRHLARHYRVLDLESATVAAQQRSLPPNAVVVTFDDGYRDVFTDAFPILRRHGLPAMVFLTTGAIGSGEILWHDRVFRAFSLTRVPELRFGPEGRSHVLRGAGDRSRVRDEILGYLKSLDEQPRSEQIGLLLEELEVEDVPRAPGLMLDWDEVREMERNGITFGSHTVSHPILSRVPEERVRRELEDSKTALERELERPARSFAYPNGQAADFNPTVTRLLAETGYRFAVTTIPGVNRIARGAEPETLLTLRRDVPWENEPARFAARMVINRVST